MSVHGRAHHDIKRESSMVKRRLAERRKPALSGRKSGGRSHGLATEFVIDFEIVGIGASSRGLDTVKALLRTLPDRTGCAFILVQHADLTSENTLAELSSAETSMKVVQATDGIALKPEHVYVASPGFYISAGANGLHLTATTQDHDETHRPFDFLLHSMARECGSHAVAILLAGTGADGFAAAGSIRDAGGLVMMQEPGEAGFDEMHRNAIRSAIDAIVLPVARMPEAIANHVAVGRSRPGVSVSADGMIPLTEIIDLLRTAGANDFSSYKRGILKRRVEKRLAALGIPLEEMDRYISRLKESEEERRHLAKDLLVNLTGFFRDAQVFRFLREKVIPDLLLGKGPDDTVRIWIAGCSTGEEAYSLAILFLERIEAMGVPMKLQVFASDADADAVAFAREGHYPPNAVESVPPELLQSYFTKDETGYGVTAELRAAIVFAVQNVLSDPPFSHIDLVSCRNLLIYLEADAQAKALALFGFALRENGVLVLGTSETVGRMADSFEVISKPQRIYRRVEHSRSGKLRLNTAPADNGRLRASPGRTTSASLGKSPIETFHRALLDRYAPAALLINGRYEYLYSTGPIAKFLHIAPGPASHDLFAITPKALHNKIRAAIHRARQGRQRFVARGASIENNGAAIRFGIHVEPVPAGDEDYFLICFVEDTAPDRRGELQEAAPPGDTIRAAELEIELEETRAELQAAIRNLEIASEEQKIINAEAFSLTEEYQSANEELVTSKEELQSLNQELASANNRLQEALERQRAISKEVENVLHGMDVATLYLDSALNIRLFTPAAQSLFSIIASDIGRPLSDLTTLTNDGTLEADALDALKSEGSVEREVNAGDGRWYIRRIKPFRAQDGRIEGVVVTLVDVSIQKQISEDREAAKKSAELASAAKSHFLAAASHDLRQPLQTLKLLQGLLEKNVEDEQSRTLVLRMEETLASMSAILSTVLDINQIEAGTVQPRFESFAIGDLLLRMRREFSYPAQAKGLKLRVIPSALAVRTDPQLLEQIIRNLLSNALKYTLTGRILLGCRRRGGKLRLEVWDTGIGIPKNQIGNIFNEYYQLDMSARRGDRGLGLGLSIVKRLSDLLGLKLSIRSHPQKGSVFSLEIDRVTNGQPLVALPSSGTRAEQDRPSPAASILIVEDEDAVRELLKMGLEQAGHAVATAANALEAVRLVRQGDFTPDIVLADYNISSAMDGLAAIENIRSILNRQIPGLILTGDISSHALDKYADYNIPHLNKPVKLSEVVHAIDDLLAQSEKKDAAEDDGKAGRTEALPRPLIEIVDDEQGVRNNIRALFENVGWEVLTYASAEDFLASYDPDRANCLILDAYLPGMSGLDLLRKLEEKQHRFPVVVITGHSDIHMAVDAMKHGAADFLEKPFSFEEIQLSVRTALEHVRGTSHRSDRREAARAALTTLTRRQREILDRILLGQPNKIIAAELGLSQRTVENHRASIMRRTGSASLPALLRLVVTAEE
ncbi:CheR family methyltransferase [Neorhizobium petrolearium]|uniref:CheR family methyltransferase n=1 Tax=Neorhizobium petrolearium TaxID=515361 RepID=UPI003F5CD6F4